MRGGLIVNRKHFRTPSPFLIFLDFESNSPGSPFGHVSGPDGWDDPISLFMIKTDSELNILDEIDVRFAPTGRWSLDSEKVHGITEKEARNYPPQSEGLEKIIEFIDPGSTIVFHAAKIGHYFDYGMMLGLFEKHEKRAIFYQLFPYLVSTVDVLREAVKSGKFEPVLSQGSDGRQRQSYRLNLWCERLGIELDHHNAQSDTRATYEIFKRVTTSQQSGKTPSREQQAMTLL